VNCYLKILIFQILTILHTVKIYKSFKFYKFTNITLKHQNGK